MEFLKKCVAVTGVATAILVSGAAQAATLSNPTASYTKTIVAEADRSRIDIVTGVYPPEGFVLNLGANESLDTNDGVVLTLSNGATWSTIVSRSLVTGRTPTDEEYLFTLVWEGEGESQATFVPTRTIPGGNVIRLIASATVDASQVPVASTVTLTTQIRKEILGEYRDVFGTPLIHNLLRFEPLYFVSPTRLLGLTPGLFTQQFVPSYSATPARPVTGIFSVATGFTELTAATSSDVLAPRVTSRWGYVATIVSSRATVGSVCPVAGAGCTANVPSALPGAGRVLYSIVGNMAGVASITGTGLTGTTSAGETPRATTDPDQYRNRFAIDRANNIAYATNTAAIPVPLLLSRITIIFASGDDAIAQQAGNYLLSVEGLAQGTDYAASGGLLTDVPLFSFTRDGASFVSNSLGPLNRLTITDLSGSIGSDGADGVVIISAYDTAGAAVTCTGLDIPDLVSNGTVTIEGSAIIDACLGVKRIQGFVNSTSILSTNIKMSEDGVTVQSGLSPNDGATAAN